MSQIANISYFILVTPALAEKQVDIWSLFKEIYIKINFLAQKVCFA